MASLAAGSGSVTETRGKEKSTDQASTAQVVDKTSGALAEENARTDGSKVKERRRSSFSLEDNEVDRIAAMGVSFIEEIHVSAPVPDEEALRSAKKLESAIMETKEATDAIPEVLEPILEPANLQRILRARKFNHDEALELALQILKWRKKERPDLLRADKDLELECCTGKARVADEFDRHGRPLLVLDSSAENTSDPKKQVRHVLYQMERIIRRMESSPNTEVEKQCVFCHLNDFSIWSCPSMSNSKQTVAILSKYFCERMGHGIAFQRKSIYMHMSSPNATYPKPHNPDFLRHNLFVLMRLPTYINMLQFNTSSPSLFFDIFASYKTVCGPCDVWKDCYYKRGL